MNLTAKQIDTRDKIRTIATAIDVDPGWAISVAMVESSLGMNQVSPTGCKGVFQMSLVAMKDLLAEMPKNDNEWIDILCGLAFLLLLKRRWGTIDAATAKFCDPAVVDDYLTKVKQYMEVFKDV